MKDQQELARAAQDNVFNDADHNSNQVWASDNNSHKLCTSKSNWSVSQEGNKPIQGQTRLEELGRLPEALEVPASQQERCC